MKSIALGASLVLACLCSTVPLLGSQAASAKRPDIYVVDGKGLERIEQARILAGMDNRRLLLMIGGNWCGWCHKLHNLLEDNAELKALMRSEYLLIHIDSQADRAVIEKWDIHTQGYPYLTILDAEGRKIVEQETGSLEVGSAHDPARVKAFLEAWTPQAWDAQTRLQQALTQAREQHKQVFFRIGSPTCGWCRRMDDFLAQPAIKTALEKDFVILKIDLQRMTHAQEVAEKIRGRSPGGIPWFAFLDGQGRILQTSINARGSNIGFPVDPDTEIAHFRGMLDQARAHMTPEDVTLIIEALQKK